MAQWKRARLVVTGDTRGVFLGGVMPTITLRPSADTGKLRIGLWVVNERLAGWLVPFLPANMVFTIRQGRASGYVDGVLQDLPGQLLDWDGARWPARNQLMPHGSFVLSLDQEPTKAIPVLVDVSVEAVEL
jgi:hypothetical protein